MATFLNDTFTDTNAVNLTAHTGETGATWLKNGTAATGNFLVQSNRIYASTITAIYYASGTPTTADYEVEATVNIVTTGVDSQQTHACGRYSTSANSGYVFGMHVTGGVWQCFLQRYAAGAATTLGSITTVTTPTAGTDHTIKLRMVRNQISGYYDGALLIGPITDATYTTAGVAGITGRTVAPTSTTGVHVAGITARDITRGGKVTLAAPLIRSSLY